MCSSSTPGTVCRLATSLFVIALCHIGEEKERWKCVRTIQPDLSTRGCNHARVNNIFAQLGRSVHPVWALRAGAFPVIQNTEEQGVKCLGSEHDAFSRVEYLGRAVSVIGREVGKPLHQL